MAQRFFITGLPRSRTAWWAVATGAEHEPTALRSVPAILERWRGGISDSGLGMHLPRVLNEAAPKTLVINRPVAAVEASLRWYLGESAAMDWDHLRTRLRALESVLTYEHPLIKRVDYAELNLIEVVRECLDWLEAPEPERLGQLMHMNVQSDLAHNLALVEKRRA